jgi:hypothetical protein
VKVGAKRSHGRISRGLEVEALLSGGVPGSCARQRLGSDADVGEDFVADRTSEEERNRDGAWLTEPGAPPGTKMKRRMYP